MVGRPRIHDEGARQRSTPLARVLIGYMWDVRRHGHPLSVPELARRLDMSRQTLYNVLYKAVTPGFDRVLELLARLDIPLETLVDAYRTDGLDVPRLLRREDEPPVEPVPATPAPRRYQPPAAARDEWDALIDATTETLRASGIPEEAIQQAVERIRQKQRGDATLQRQRIAEHTPAAPTTPEPKRGRGRPPRRDPASSTPLAGTNGDSDEPDGDNS